MECRTMRSSWLPRATMKDQELLKRNSSHHPSSPPAPLCAQASSQEGVFCTEHKGDRFKALLPSMSLPLPAPVLQAQILINTYSFRKGFILQETIECNFEFIYTQIRGRSSLGGSGCPLSLLAGEQEKLQSTQPNFCSFSISPIWQWKKFDVLGVKFLPFFIYGFFSP